MYHLNTVRPVSRKLLLLAATALMSGGILAPSTASAQAATGREQAYEFDIPAQSLATSVAAVSAKTGIQVLFPDSQSTDMAPAISGRMTVSQALDKLTGGTQIVWRFTSSGVVTLERIKTGAENGERVLGAVRVEGAQSSESGVGGSAINGVNGSTDVTATEGSGSYATNAVSIGGKTPTNPREVQQSVSVLTAERIKDQNINNLTDAMAQSTGITLVQSDGTQTNIYSRGFEIKNVQTDGGAAGYVNGYGSWLLPDMAAYDHVELLRGADGLFAGTGDAGGTVNLVRKRPLDHNQIVVDLSGGSWNHYRAQLDATGPIGWGGRLRARVVAARESQDYFYDIAWKRSYAFYGIVEVDLTPSTLVSVGANIQDVDNNPFYYGLPRYSTGADLGLPRVRTH